MRDVIEFQTWLNDLGRKFPAVRDWVRGIGDQCPADQDALLESWERALADLDLADCLEANQGMVSGELEPPGDRPAQWQGIPARVRSHAIYLAAHRLPDSPRTQSDEVEHQRNVFVRVRERAGWSRREINAALTAAGFENIAFKEPKQ